MKKRLKKYIPNFEKLKIRFTDNLREDYVGDWNIHHNTLYIHNKLNDEDKIGVIVHEFIEMVTSALIGVPDCCLPEYNEKIHHRKNLLAHRIANLVERKLLRLGGYKWHSHEKRVCDLVNKRRLENNEKKK